MENSSPEAENEEQTPHTDDHYDNAETDPIMEEMSQIIEDMKKDKAPGEDGITAELLKSMGTAAKQQLYDIIMKVWEEEILPESWLTGTLILIHKKGDK